MLLGTKAVSLPVRGIGPKIPWELGIATVHNEILQPFCITGLAVTGFEDYCTINGRGDQLLEIFSTTTCVEAEPILSNLLGNKLH